MQTEEFIRDAASRKWSKRQTMQALGVCKQTFYAMLEAMPPLEWPAKGKSIGHILSNESKRGIVTPTLLAALEIGRAVRRGKALRVVDGVSATTEEHASRSGVSYATVRRRLKIGMSLEDALSKPPMPFALRRNGFANEASAKKCGGFEHGN